MRKLVILTLLIIGYGSFAQGTKIDKEYASIEDKIIEWRRYFHEHPELSNREFETAKKIAEHLESLGIEVQTGVAHTGVVGILKGNKPGKVVALRADMDALPVTERNDLPFKSNVTSEYLGKEVGVMHACGHDTHVAILMGVAEIMSKHKDKIKGTVKFDFFSCNIYSISNLNFFLLLVQNLKKNIKINIISYKGKYCSGAKDQKR